MTKFPLKNEAKEHVHKTIKKKTRSTWRNSKLQCHYRKEKKLCLHFIIKVVKVEELLSEETKWHLGAAL